MKQHVMSFGRFNPPTTGHMKLIDKVHDVAKSENADHSVVVSHTNDKKKNPLTTEQKKKHLSRFSPETNVKSSSKSSPTILHQAAELHKQGVEHLHVVAGSDRHEELHKLLHAYNGKKGPHGHYKFKKITVHSSGERDPDAEGDTGISATKQREHAKNNDFKNFRKGVPSHVSDSHARELMHDVRNGQQNEDIQMNTLDSLFEDYLIENSEEVQIEESELQQLLDELDDEQLDIQDDDEEFIDALVNDLLEEIELEEALVGDIIQINKPGHSDHGKLGKITAFHGDTYEIKQHNGVTSYHHKQHVALLKDVDEARVLTIPQRLKLRQRFKIINPRLQRLRQIKAKRFAPQERLAMRSRKAALMLLRRRVAGKTGQSYHSLSPAQRVNVDKAVKQRFGNKLDKFVGVIGKRILPFIRKKEMARLSKARGGGGTVTKMGVAVEENLPKKLKDIRHLTSVGEKRKKDIAHDTDESVLPVTTHKSPYEGAEVGEYTTIFHASPNSAQKFAQHVISKGGKARIGRRGQDHYVYHKGAGPISKEDWRKSQVNEEHDDSMLTPKVNLLLRLGLVDADEIEKYRRALRTGEKSLASPELRNKILSMLDRILKLATDDPQAYSRMRQLVVKHRATEEIDVKKQQDDERERLEVKHEREKSMKKFADLRKKHMSDEYDPLAEDKILESLKNKSDENDIPFEVLKGLYDYEMSESGIPESAFNYVNSYIAEVIQRSADVRVVKVRLKDGRIVWKKVRQQTAVQNEELDAMFEDEFENYLDEQKHRISVTVSDPNHPAVTKRDEKHEKFVRVAASSNDEAIDKAKAHYKNSGYKVHDANHVGMVSEVLDTKERKIDYVGKAFASGNELQAQANKETDPEKKAALLAKLSKRNRGVIKVGKDVTESNSTCPNCHSANIKTFSDKENQCHDCKTSWNVKKYDHTAMIRDIAKSAASPEHKKVAIDAIQKMKRNEELNLEESSTRFIQKVNQAANAAASGNHKNAKMHLDNARSFMFGVKSTDTGKIKDAHDTYKKLRTKYSGSGGNYTPKDNMIGIAKIHEGHYEDAEKHLANAKKAEVNKDSLGYHDHMANHHDSLSQWHETKGRWRSAGEHAEKSEHHGNEVTKLATAGGRIREGYAEDDIALGGTVIYKHGSGHAMSKAVSKTGLKVKTQSGHEVPFHHVVSTDASDWKHYKSVNEEGGAGGEGTDALRKKYASDTPGQQEAITIAPFSAKSPLVDEADENCDTGKSPMTYKAIRLALSGKAK